MSKTISILLVLSAAVSFAVDEWGFETVSLDLLPENAEEQALELVEKWRVTVYPDENITIGELIRLYAPDFQERGICVPVALDHEGSLTIADGIEANRLKYEAHDDLSDYKSTLDWFSEEAARERAYSGDDEQYSLLRGRVTKTSNMWLLYRYMILGFSNGEPFIIGTNNPRTFTQESESTNDEGELGILVDYGFYPENNDQIGILGIYETKGGERFLHKHRDNWDPKFVDEFFYFKIDLTNFRFFDKVLEHQGRITE